MPYSSNLESLLNVPRGIVPIKKIIMDRWHCVSPTNRKGPQWRLEATSSERRVSGMLVVVAREIRLLVEAKPILL